MCVRLTVAALATLGISVAAVAQPTYEEVVKSLDPVHWWRLNEPVTNNTANDSADDLHGVWHNGPNPVPGFTPDSDAAADFWDASGFSHVIFDHAQSLQLSQGSIAFTFKDTGRVLNAGIISKDSNDFDSGGHLTIGTRPNNNDPTEKSGRLFVRLQSDSASHTVATNNINVGEVNDAVFTFGQDGMKLYVKGQLVDQDSYNGGMDNNREPMAFGASTARSGNQVATPLTNHWSGHLDEVIVFDRALTADEIGNLREGVIPEPATLALIALGTLLITWRRHLRHGWCSSSGMR